MVAPEQQTTPGMEDDHGGWKAPGYLLDVQESGAGMTRRPVVFLDIDGVLNARGAGDNDMPLPGEHPWMRMSARRVCLLNQIPAIFVISSSWRHALGEFEIYGMLRVRGFAQLLGGMTPRRLPRSCGSETALRGAEISWWLEMHGAGCHYAVLDDDAVTGHGGHFVWIDGGIGLQQSDIPRVLAALDVLP